MLSMWILSADSKDTVLRVLNKLHRIFIVEEGIRWLVVVGDAKTYDILQNLRREYGGQLQWITFSELNKKRKFVAK